MDAVPPSKGDFGLIESLLARIDLAEDAATWVITGKNYYDSVRHGMARLAYLNEFLMDHDVRQLMERWRVDTGLARAQEDALVLIRRVKSLVGAEAWAVGMSRGSVTLKLSDVGKADQVQRLAEARDRALDAFSVAHGMARIDGQVAAALERDAGAFVQRYSVKHYKKRSMNWPWLPGELIGHFWFNT